MNASSHLPDDASAELSAAKLDPKSAFHVREDGVYIDQALDDILGLKPRSSNLKPAGSCSSCGGDATALTLEENDRGRVSATTGGIDKERRGISIVGDAAQEVEHAKVGDSRLELNYPQGWANQFDYDTHDLKLDEFREDLEDFQEKHRDLLRSLKTGTMVNGPWGTMVVVHKQPPVHTQKRRGRRTGGKYESKNVAHDAEDANGVDITFWGEKGDGVCWYEQCLTQWMYVLDPRVSSAPDVCADARDAWQGGLEFTPSYWVGGSPPTQHFVGKCALAGQAQFQDGDKYGHLLGFETEEAPGEWCASIDGRDASWVSYGAVEPPKSGFSCDPEDLDSLREETEEADIAKRRLGAALHKLAVARAESTAAAAEAKRIDEEDGGSADDKRVRKAAAEQASADAKRTVDDLEESIAVLRKSVAEANDNAESKRKDDCGFVFKDTPSSHELAGEFLKLMQVEWPKGAGVSNAERCSHLGEAANQEDFLDGKNASGQLFEQHIVFCVRLICESDGVVTEMGRWVWERRALVKVINDNGRGGVGGFEYDEDWLESDGAIPMGPNGTGEGVYTTREVCSYVSDPVEFPPRVDAEGRESFGGLSEKAIAMGSHCAFNESNHDPSKINPEHTNKPDEAKDKYGDS